MNSGRSSGLDAILNRSRPSLWQRFWRSPCVFLAQRLYNITTRPTAQGRAKINAVTVVCVSDTHNSRTELPEGDLLIHAGDLTQSGSFEELQQAIDWIRSQPHRHKVVVAGNHDVLLDDSRDHGLLHRHDPRTRDELEWGDVVYLQDSSVAVDCPNERQLRIYGSPRSAKNGNWAFQYSRLENVWENVVPSGTDILITHGPPRAHLDLLNLGCVHLLSEIWRVKPLLHVFGHVHEGYGQEHLYYDGVQKAFETVVVERGGLLNLVGLLRETLLWCFTSMKAPRTLLVNPAMVGGLRDEVKRKPIVVTI